MKRARNKFLPSLRHLPERRKRLSVTALLIVLIYFIQMTMPTEAMSGNVLEQIRRRGIISIGVKTDFAPFGMLSTSGVPEGFEIDLAKGIAHRLGVKLSLVNVTTENRFQKLEQGAIDLMIATAADTRERRQIATAIEPDYYAGGVSLLLRPEHKITSWSEVRGQKICASRGAYFNRPMSQRYLLDLNIYNNVRDALLALREDQCIGFLYSSGAMQTYLQQPVLADYRAPLPTAMTAPWAIYMSRLENNTEYQHIIEDIVVEWHRTGFLIEREKAWKIQPSKFLAEMHLLWSRQSEGGRYYCARGADGGWPAACKNKTFVRSEEFTGLHKIGLWIEENTGMNFTFVFDRYDRYVFLKGIIFTVLIMIASIVISLLLGVTGALICEAGSKLVSKVINILAVYGRTTPPLLQMYLLFFGIGSFLRKEFSINISPILVAILCISCYTGSSIMISLLEAVKHRRILDKKFRLRLTNIAAVTEFSAVPIKAGLINVTKQSVLASALAVPELLNATMAIIADQGNINIMMNTFLFIFLALVSLSFVVLERFERRLISMSRKQL